MCQTLQIRMGSAALLMSTLAYTEYYPATRFHEFCNQIVDFEVRGMEGIQFTGGTIKRGDLLRFTCSVKYPAALDPFLSSELTMLSDRSGSLITPFSDGKGRFEADSLENAEETEAEIKALLQSAYRGLLDLEKRVEMWTGIRESALHTEENAVVSPPD